MHAVLRVVRTTIENVAVPLGYLVAPSVPKWIAAAIGDHIVALIAS